MRTALITSIGLLLFAGASQAGKYQLFTYRSGGGEPRVCKGDTESGQAICADGTASSATATGAALPTSWNVKQTARANYLRYRLGDGGSAAGRYQFFTYYSDKLQVRVCAGDTATGVAVCADGTTESASADGASPPSNWTVKKTANILLLKYFWAAQAEPGSYGFDAYSNSRGQARVCRMDTANGAVLCTDGTAVSAQVSGQAPPNWLTNPKAKALYFSF